MAAKTGVGGVVITTLYVVVGGDLYQPRIEDVVRAPYLIRIASRRITVEYVAGYLIRGRDVALPMALAGAR